MQMSVVLVLAIAIECAALADARAGHNTVVTVTRWEAACGGAGHPPRAHPAVRERLLIRKGNTNTNQKPIAEITTDNNGRFAIDLPKGTYCVVTPDKRKVPAAKSGPPAGSIGSCSPGDADCAAKKARECDAL